MSSTPCTIVVADDHPVVRIGVRNILNAEEGFKVVGEAGDGDVVVQLVRALHPGVLLLDLQMPRLPGLDTLRALASESTQLKTIILSGLIEPPQILEALQLGAQGIVHKEMAAEHLVLAVRTVIGGGYWLGGRPLATYAEAVMQVTALLEVPPNRYNLTAREREIVKAIVEGLSNKEIASRFSITEDTVKRHLTNIFDKTGVSSRLELAMFAVHHKLS